MQYLVLLFSTEAAEAVQVMMEQTVLEEMEAAEMDLLHLPLKTELLELMA
jgi:hypothetical protein